MGSFFWTFDCLFDSWSLVTTNQAEPRPTVGTVDGMVKWGEIGLKALTVVVFWHFWEITLRHRSNGPREMVCNLLQEYFPALHHAASKLRVLFFPGLVLRCLSATFNHMKPWSSISIWRTSSWNMSIHGRCTHKAVKPELFRRAWCYSQGQMAWSLETGSRRLHPLQPPSTASLGGTNCKASEQKRATFDGRGLGLSSGVPEMVIQHNELENHKFQWENSL